MGWLFAVSLALQEGRERALWRSLPPIAAGHLLALALVAFPLFLLGALLPLRSLALLAAATLLAFGAWKLARWYRHPRWVGMKVGSRDLVVWSFLMASGHGAGLMVAPALVTLMGDGPAAARGGDALLGVALHTAALLVVMAVVAVTVYRLAGLAVLRSAWFNFDLLWAAALLVTGGVALVRAVAGG